MNNLSPRRESFFYHKGLPCVVIFTTLGHRCGYVGVPNNHPLSHIDYTTVIMKPELLERIENSPIDKKGIIPVLFWDEKSVTPELLFNVHGGLTYSNKYKNYPIYMYEPIWWFGFDCNHYNDQKDLKSFKEYYPLNYFNKIKNYINIGGIIRSKTYVEDECKSLAEQLVEIEEILNSTKEVS